MGDAILERGQQQLKDVARVAVLELTRTRRGARERGGKKNRRGSRDGEATRKKKLGQVRQVTAPAVRGGFSVLAAVVICVMSTE